MKLQTTSGMRAAAWARLLPGLCAVLLAAGCGGGGVTAGNAPASQPSAPAPPGEAGTLGLQLSATREGEAYRVVLAAPLATDLYQVAGTLNFDPQAYEVQRVEAGGGLGDPQSSYFLNATARPGQLGFAYTKRLAGPGASGAVSLVHFIVNPKRGAFNLSDFTLHTAQQPLKARDSKKHDFSVTITRGAVQR